MNVTGDTNQVASAGEEAALDHMEAAKTLEQTKRQPPMAEYTAALRTLLGGLAQ